MQFGDAKHKLFVLFVVIDVKFIGSKLLAGIRLEYPGFDKHN